MRFPLSQTVLTNRVQAFMQSLADRGSVQSGQHHKSDMLKRLLGMKDLAEDLGVSCDCFDTEWGSASTHFVCRCRPMTPRERAEHR